MKLSVPTMRLRQAKFIAHITGMFVMLCTASFAWTQQPFNTDDADVTDKEKFHIEIANEFDRLQPTSLPVNYQSTFRATISYGLIKNVEISIGGQFLTLVSRGDPRYIGGIGDTTVAVKYNFRKEHKNSRMPALTLSGFAQLPTGSVRRGLGSGVTDYGINFIAQKSFHTKNVFRSNAGLLFAGNTVNGALGFSPVRGQVFTGGVSYVRTLNKKLQLGGEITGAVADNFQLSSGQLQGQFGGNYQINEKTSFDFGIITGRFAASPRIGIQIGFSHDF